MRRLVVIAVVLFFVGGAFYMCTAGGSRPTESPSSAGKAIVGQPAPDFTLEDTYGRQVSLSALRGKVVLVNFWASWCPPCRAEMPSMDELNKLMQDEDFVMLAINIEQNGRQVVPAFLQKSPHTFSVLYDDKAMAQNAYGVYKFPETFIVRKDGMIDDKVAGAIDWAHPKTVAYFKSLTAKRYAKE